MLDKAEWRYSLDTTPNLRTNFYLQIEVCTRKKQTVFNLFFAPYGQKNNFRFFYHAHFQIAFIFNLVPRPKFYNLAFCILLRH